MQLHQTEYSDIKELLRRWQMTEAASFVKRKGWVFIELKGHSFAFHRKKVTKLENGRFIDSSEYYTNFPQKPAKVDGWPEVIQQMEEWMQVLSTPDKSA